MSDGRSEPASDDAGEETRQQEEAGRTSPSGDGDIVRTLSRKLRWGSLVVFMLSVVYNAGFVSVISKLEPSVTAMAIYEGFLHTCASAFLAGLGILSTESIRRRRRMGPIWGYLHLAYYGNAVCAIYFGFTIATALTSVFPITEFDNLEWLQIVRVSSLSLLMVGYMVCAYWAKDLSLHLTDGGFAPGGAFDEESLLPGRHESIPASVSTHSDTDSQAPEVEMQTSNPIFAAANESSDEDDDSGGGGDGGGGGSGGVHL